MNSISEHETLEHLSLDLTAKFGSSIDQVAADACVLATRLGLTVWFSFNAQRLHAGPSDTPRVVVSRYRAYYLATRRSATGSTEL